MTYYAKFTPYLVASTTQDYSSNLLADPISEIFTVARIIERTNVSLTANYGNAASFDLTSWTKITEIRVTNTGTAFIEVDWHTPVTVTGPGDTDTYNYIPPGRTMIIPGARPVSTVFGHAGSVNVWGIDATLPSTADITILGT